MGTIESESDILGKMMMRTGDGKMETIQEYEQEQSEEYERRYKCSCSCHGKKDIYATNDGVLLEYDGVFDAGDILHTASPHHCRGQTSSELNLDFLETAQHESGCELWNAMQGKFHFHHHHQTNDDEEMTKTMGYIEQMAMTNGGGNIMSDGEDE